MMRICAILCLLSSLAVAQTLATSANPSIDAQALARVQEAIAAQAGASVVQDVQLEGTVVTHTGTDHSGTVTLHADIQGRSSISLNLDSGKRTEYVSGLNEETACTWALSDGTVRQAAHHNCLLPASWILPIFSISQGVSNGTVTVQQLPDSSDHLKAQRVFTGNADVGTRTLIEKVSTAEITLDPQTHLPAKLTFNVHPDNDMGRDLPVEVTYSDYRSVNGVQVPFHIDKRLNGSLVLEISIGSASLNTGVPVKP